MSKKVVNTLLAAVEKDLGMEKGAMALDEDGQSFVQVDEDGSIVSMDYIPKQDQLVLSVMLDPPEDGAAAAAHAAMLRANFLWQDTFGATLSLDPENDQPVLMHHVKPAELEASDLIELVEGMADLGQHLNAEIAAAGSDAVAAGDEGPAPGAGDFIRG